MLLSKLVYLCVKNAVYYDDKTFAYETFKKGIFDDDPDYSTNIHNVFSPLNMAIARLNDLNRIPFSVIDMGEGDYVRELKNDDDEYIQFTEIMGAAAIDERGSIRPLNFKNDKKTITILSPLYPLEKLFVEYKEDIPFLSNSEDFSEEGYYYHYVFNKDYETDIETEDTENSVDVELRELGITDTMCNYIIEYVRGCLLEPIDVQLGNLHLARAEQYFVNIPVYTGVTAQRQVERVYRIGE